MKAMNKIKLKISLISCWKRTFTSYFESGPFSIYIQSISLQIYLQPPSVTNHVPIISVVGSNLISAFVACFALGWF